MILTKFLPYQVKKNFLENFNQSFLSDEILPTLVKIIASIGKIADVKVYYDEIIFVSSIGDNPHKRFFFVHSATI